MEAANTAEEQLRRSSCSSDCKSLKDDARDESLVVRNNDFLTKVVATDATLTKTVRNLAMEQPTENREIVMNNLMKKANRSNDVGGSLASKFSSSDSKTVVSSCKAHLWRRDETVDKDSLVSAVRTELAQNFNREPGIVSDEDFGDEKSAEHSDSGQSQSKIELHVIESCDPHDLNPTGPNDRDNNYDGSKRTRTFSEGFTSKKNDDVDDEPAEKRARSDANWSKHYERHFVFGTPTHVFQETSGESKLDNDSAVTESKITQTSSTQVEQRSIFTLDGSPTRVTFPTTKD